jgi:hypothetical protein
MPARTLVLIFIGFTSFWHFPVERNLKHARVYTQLTREAREV